LSRALWSGMAVGGAVGADVVVWVVLVAGRAGGGGGVQVERPQPEARTNDLDAGGERRTLDGVDDQVSSVVVPQGGCSHRVPRGGGG
jgi:hypothetical protein